MTLSQRLMFQQSSGTSVRTCAVLGALFAVAAACMTGCQKKKEAPPPPPPPTVEVAKPVKRDIVEWDEFTGRLAAVETVEIRPRVSGYLDSIHFKEGQPVKKGDLLFVIDSRPFRATLAVAEADVAGAKARLELARNDVKRAEGLVQSRALSAEEFDKRQNAAVEAQTTLDAAKARAEEARLNVEYTEVRAPIDGRASNYSVTVGNLIIGGAGGLSTLLTTIVSQNPIYCYFDGSEAEYLKYTRLAASGTRPSSRNAPNPVRMALVDETEYRHEGRMNFVDNRLDQATGTIRARAVFDNADGLLLPGMFVKVQLIGESKSGAIMLPDRALGTDQSNRVVYVIDDKNIVSLKQVTTGRLIDGLRVIRTGLTGDERVIVTGVQRARPGSPVTPENVEIGAVKPAGDKAMPEKGPTEKTEAEKAPAEKTPAEKPAADKVSEKAAEKGAPTP